MLASKRENKNIRRLQRKKKMKFYMTHINNQSRVNNSQIATKDGKIVFVRISLIRKAS